jgi:hypothetical protein
MDQLDLFGPPVESQRPHGKSSGSMGESPAAHRQRNRREPELAIEVGSQWLADSDSPLPSPDLTPRQVLEQWLREQAIPYIDAEQVKAGLPSRNRLQSFDFVVLGEEANWLLAACHENPSDHLASDLREWERILGPGFVAVLARVDDDGGMTLRTIDGDRVDLALPKAPTPSSCNTAPPADEPPPVVEPPVPPPAASPRAKRTLRDVVEQYLQDRKIPYVDVNEAKRALFASAKLGSFHFVAYSKTGPNWLIWAAHLRRQARLDLAEWEKVFGEGFVALIAKEKRSGELTFKRLAGEPVEIA